MKHTRLLMTLSALVLAALGLPCVFAPEIVLASITGSTAPGPELIVQITGALYFGFAGLNWMGRGSLIGGIYGRPVAIGNLMHFLVGGLALIKAASSAPASALLWPLSILYLLFALCFAVIVFGNPLRASTDKPA